MLSGITIILGISGSIAAYKAILLLRLLKKAGARVKVVTTEAVGQFVGDLTLSSLSGESVFSGLWEEGWSEHVELGTTADLMIVAPATANTLAKFAHGLCDNALTAVYLAARCPIMVAPAMDADMYIHPRTAANLRQLEEDGVQVLPVDQGFLASGLEGPGRMLEPEEIYDRICQQFSSGPLSGKKVLVTAGPTRESIDPVRFITNHSSGKMGYAMAKVARQLGAEVTLVSGPVQISPPSGVSVELVDSAAQMFEVVTSKASEQDIIIKAAAVADYTPADPTDQKMKKTDSDLSIPLNRTRDILKTLGEHKPAGQVLIGFALETQHALANARSKLARKNLDMILLNTLEDSGAGFGHDTNVVTLIDRWGREVRLPLLSKYEVAEKTFQHILTYLMPSTTE